jgi:inner membrane protein
MDNLAHALVGAALGRAVADRRMPAPALTGAVAANAPDWTELFLGLPGDGPAYLVLHRGVTHALAGAAAQIAVLTLLVQLGGRWWARRRGADGPAWPWTAAAVGACVLSHLYMDWQGSYGLRPLLPWNSRWHYGDLVAIVDPFFWFVPLVALAWGARRHWGPALGFALPAAALLTAVVAVPLVAVWVKAAAAALLLLAMAGWTAHWFGVAGRRRAAAYGLALLALYVGGHAVAGIGARSRARDTAVRRFGPTAGWAALTVPGRPFYWEPMAASDDTVAGAGWALPRQLEDARVRLVLDSTRAGRAMAQFARFLAAEVDTTAHGLTVVLRDARYARTADSGWGVLTVTLGTDPPT